MLYISHTLWIVICGIIGGCGAFGSGMTDNLAFDGEMWI
jgi:hypothetical protein